MTTKEKPIVKISFPWGLYFRQLFASNYYVRFINPLKFWRRYKIEHLETCSAINPTEHLELCYQKKYQPQKTRAAKIERNQLSFSGDRYVPEQLSPNLLVVVEPTIKLKYRGVEYQKTQIRGVYVYPILIDANSTELNRYDASIDMSNDCNSNFNNSNN